MKEPIQTTMRAKCRGRPALVHDNRRVRAFMRHFVSAFELAQEWPRLEDALTGVTLLQSEGREATRPMSKRLLFIVLRQCEAISTKNVAEVIGRDYSPATVGRYAAHARVASKAIERFLDEHPTCETDAVILTASREEIDAPYLAEARALGLA